MKRAAAILGLLLLGGCATSRYVATDPDNPKQTCEQTLEGAQAKNVCY